MKQDQFGLPITTRSDRAVEAYNRDMNRLLAMSDDGEPLFNEAIAADEGFALAHIAQARHLILTARPVEARATAARAVTLAAGLGPREKAHVEIVALAINGQSVPALDAVRKHVETYPRDGLVLSLALGVYGLIAFSGRREHHREQRDLLASLAPHWPDHWWFLGMYSWSHTETGEPAKGAVLGDRSLELNPRNAQAVHARTHAHIELGEWEQAGVFLNRWIADYRRENMLHCHLSWHKALCELEAGRPEAAFETYMSSIRPGAVGLAAVPKLADSASILWRFLALGSGPQTLPWQEVAELADKVCSRAGLAFGDVHAAMAWAATGNRAALDRQIGELDKAHAEGKLRQGEIVPLLCRALAAFAEGKDAEVLRLLDGAMTDLPRIAGSHAQREVFEDMLIAACIRSKRHDRARALVGERLARRRRPQDARWMAAAGV